MKIRELMTSNVDLLRRIVEADSCGQAVDDIMVSYP